MSNHEVGVDVGMLMLNQRFPQGVMDRWGLRLIGSHSGSSPAVDQSISHAVHQCVEVLAKAAAK